MESIEATCYAMVSGHVSRFLVLWTSMRGTDRAENNTDVRFNLVNHNNHGVDVSKYEK